MDFPLPDNETERLQALEAYDVLASPAEYVYDDLAELAAQLCGCPIGFVNMLGGTDTRLKGKYGLPPELTGMPRNVTCCATTICRSDLLVAPDLVADERFCDFPGISDEPFFRFYAGMPLINPQGYALGTLCIMDFEPRQLSFEQAEGVRCLSRQVVAQLELRRKILELASSEARLGSEKERADKLLANILPATVAEELIREQHVEPRFYDSVTIVFTDFVGFTRVAEQMEPRRLVDDLDYYFSAFDEIIARHHLEKLKTIGDAHMCVGGLPDVNRTHPVDACQAALEIQSFMGRTNRQRAKMRLNPWEVRIGIHTGSVMAGVVGTKKFAYDVWGDAVNVAARVEASGEAGRVNISEATFHRVKDRFDTEHRGAVDMKNRGLLDMYFVR